MKRRIAAVLLALAVLGTAVSGCKEKEEEEGNLELVRAPAGSSLEEMGQSPAGL